MRLMRLKSLLWSLFLVALLVGLPYLCSEAQAQRGGGGRGGGGGGARAGGGGMSGGSFRGSSAAVQGPRGGTAVQGPRGGVAAQGPRGGAVAEGPRGGAAARGPGGSAAARGPAGGAAARGPGGQTATRSATTASGSATYNRNVNVNQNWNAYAGPGYRPYAGAAVAGLAVGATVAYLSASAQPVAVNNQTYYVDGNTYYQKCYQGSEVSYCVVPNPNQ
jgi:hypothetical protein